MFDNPTHTTLDKMGEFALIDHITKHVKLTHANTVKGIGDDAAVLLKSVDTLQVITTDMLV